jgi:hypothetical protein
MGTSGGYEKLSYRIDFSGALWKYPPLIPHFQFVKMGGGSCCAGMGAICTPQQSKNMV